MILSIPEVLNELLPLKIESQHVGDDGLRFFMPQPPAWSWIIRPSLLEVAQIRIFGLTRAQVRWGRPKPLQASSDKIWIFPTT